MFVIKTRYTVYLYTSGQPLSNFGLQSLRACGATAAANVKAPDRLFKWHVHWKPENAKDGYVKDLGCILLIDL